MQNCMEQAVPVRVVRGHKCTNSYVGKVYTYDGLYKVFFLGFFTINYCQISLHYGPKLSHAALGDTNDFSQVTMVVCSRLALFPMKWLLSLPFTQ